MPANDNGIDAVAKIRGEDSYCAIQCKFFKEGGSIPKSELDKTKTCQAAVFVTSLAAVELLKEKNAEAIGDCYATAGFSVGEYASLVLAGSISYTDGRQLR